METNNKTKTRINQPTTSNPPTTHNNQPEPLVLLSPGQAPLLLERGGTEVIVAQTQQEAEQVLAQRAKLKAEPFQWIGEPIE